MQHFTLESEDPQEIRAQVVDALLERVSGQSGAFCSVYQDEEENWYFDGGVYRGSDQEIVDNWLDFSAGRPTPELPWFPAFADNQVLNHFVRLRHHYDPEFLSKFESYEEFVVPAEVGDLLRAVVLDDGRLLGWLGIARRGLKERFTKKEEKEVERLLPQLRTALLAAKNIEDSSWEDDICAVLTPRGTVEHASTGFSRWIDHQGMERIGQVVRDLDEDAINAHHSFIVAGLLVRLIRLDGPRGVRYMALTDRAELARIDPRCWLTPRQREVADYAACGATISEIADTLELSPHTVKSHLKNVYERLDVCSRMELAAMLKDE